MIRALLLVGLFCALISARAASLVRLDSSAEGIHFVQGLSWSEILAKAKRERKYIFVDCYATWCGPCKKMEKEVYSRRDVGDRFNDQFICVKAQLDSSKNDDASTRAFYSSAHYIEGRYDIRLYPTLLFFNPNGNILNRVSGAMEASDLVKIANDVQDPAKDYYALLERYNKGERDLSAMSYLARTALDLLHDSVQSEAIARAYLLVVQKKDWFSAANIAFSREFTYHSSDPGFSFFYQNADSIDRVMRDENYSEAIVQRTIYQEVVEQEISKSKKLKTTPDWNKIATTIAGKYNQYYADRVVLGAKTDWSGSRKDWSVHTEDLILYVERYSPKSDSGGQFQALYLNNFAWDIFQHSTDTAQLDIALHWSLRAVIMDPVPAWMDTYANILYKLGRRSDALKWETIALALDGEEGIKSNYQAMKAGKPTWPLD
jgi:thioredoxin-related protein